MNKELMLLKEVKEKTLERIIEKFSTGYGQDLGQMKLSIMDAKEILYEQVNKIAERVFREEFA